MWKDNGWYYIAEYLYNEWWIERIDSTLYVRDDREILIFNRD